MTVQTLKEVRRDQTAAELAAVRAAVETWVALRRDRDCDPNHVYIGRHKTQLLAVETMLHGALEALDASLGALDMESDAGEFYDRCRDLDLATVWLQRLWEFYRDKFDQRDAGPPVGPALEAADEIVWSCYHAVMDRAQARDPAVRHGAAPLAYVAPEYSPAALDSVQPLSGALRIGVDIPGWGDRERELVETLPVPLLRLPPWCVRSPWWLVYIAHEVGHEIYAALHLAGHVREGVRSAARATLSDADADRWRNWAAEIFADVFSTLMMGASAVRGVAEVERTTTRRMGVATAKYPAPAVRLALIAAAARRCDGDDADALAGIDPVAIARGDPQASRHLDAVDAVIDFLVDAPLPGTLGTLRELCGAETGSRQQHQRDVTWWIGQLTAARLPPFQPDIDTARRVCAAGVVAWQDVTAEEDALTRKSATERLAAATLGALALSGPPGTRAGHQPDVEERQRGNDIAAALLNCARTTRA